MDLKASSVMIRSTTPVQKLNQIPFDLNLQIKALHMWMLDLQDCFV